MKNKNSVIALIIRLGWIALCVYLGVDLWPTSLAWAGESIANLAFSLGLLSGPLGWVAVTILPMIISVFDSDIPPRVHYLIEWSVLSVSGYVQWFVLLPKMWAKKRDGGV